MRQEKSNDSELTRRKFLTASAGGLITAGLVNLAPLALASDDETKGEGDKKEGVIHYRTLGKTGISVPIISMGAGNCNDPGMIKAAFELGIRHFDTAANYQYGANEQLVGGVIKDMGVRDKAIIGTKIYTPNQRREMSREKLIKKIASLLDGSLSRLQTDYVDIIYIHSVDSKDDILNDDVMEAFQRLKNSGKARSVALSTHSNMTEVINAAVDSKFWEIILTSINFTMEDDAEFMAAVKRAGDNDLGMIGMKVMAGGGRWPNPDSRQNYSGSVIASAALKWVLNNKNVHTVIPAFNNHDHMKEDFAVASSIKYSDDEKKFLGDNEVKLTIDFCRQCQKCLASCPDDVDIPTLMRSHMYAAQYGDFQLARSTFDQIPKAKSLKNCVSCADCIAQCANNVNIKHRMNELKLIYG